MVDKKRPLPWPVLIGDGLLLLCALLGFAGSFLSLYGDANAELREATALDRCAANGDQFLIYAALFGLAALCAWSLPRRWGTAAGGLTALWAAAVLSNRAEAAQGAGITLRDITTLFARRVSWGQVFLYETKLRPAREAAAVQLFLLLALAGLALLLGLAIVRLRRWWVVLFLTLPPLLPGLLADLYPDWLSFMALAVCWCVMLFTALCKWAAPDRRGKLTLTVLPAVALTLALITALFPREGYTRPAWARKAQEDLLNFTSRLSEHLPRWDDGPFHSTVTYVGAAEEADLVHAGPLNYTGRTVLRVNSDRGGWMYLRGSSLAVYEDGVWRDLPGGTYEDYWSGQEPEVSPLYLPATLEQNSPVYTVTVENVGAVGSCVYAPYFPLPQDTDETGILPVADAYLARKQGQWTHTMTFVDRNPPVGLYDGGTAPVGGGDGDAFFGDGAPGSATSPALTYAEYVYDNYLTVPRDLQRTLEQCTDLWFAVQSTYSESSAQLAERLGPVQTAAQFGAYLESFCQYDDGAPAAPDGVDPVYYFLTESRRGYCMHYASAVTLMLRAVGIPARYVSGFAAEVPSNRRTNIPDRAAHAWVEVWIDGFGWYPVEVTPDAAFAWARQPDAPETGEPVESTTAPTPTPTPEPTETPVPAETPEPTGAPDRPTATPSESGNIMDGPEQDKSGPDFTALFRALKRAAPVIGVLLLIWFIQIAVKLFRIWRMSGANTNRSALVCYGYLCRLERWGGRIDTQALDLAQKARFSQHTLTRKELDIMRYLVARERARLCVVTDLPTRLAFRYWWGKPRPPVPPADWTPPKQEE